VIEEIRIANLGVIEESVLELGPGLNVVTGETGAGKTMLVTALGLLLGARSDAGAVRSGAKAARVEGIVAITDPTGPVAVAVEALGGEIDDGSLVLARQLSAEGRSRAFLGGASVPVSALQGVADHLVAVHGQSDQHRLLQAEAQRAAVDGFAGAAVASLKVEVAAGYAELRVVEAELADVLGASRERAREADVLRLGLAEIEAVEPVAGDGLVSPTPCAPPPRARVKPCRPMRRTQMPWEVRSSRDGRWSLSATMTPKPAGWLTALQSSPTCSPTSPPTSPPMRLRWTLTRLGCRWSLRGVLR
jgi:hypothetical protein